MNNNYIGIFDSGIGGLTVVKALKEMMPNENIIYFGDTKNAPYGDKSSQELIKLVSNNINFLKKYKPKAIAIGCNTADVAIDYIDTEIPLIRIIESSCKEAINNTKNNNIGIIATNATINSHTYENMINRLNHSINTYSLACPKLVPLIEKGIFSGKEVENTLKDYLGFFTDKNIDTLILGCTHYPLLTEEIKKLLPNINLISSSQCLANNIRKYLTINNQLSSNHIEDYFFTSGDISLFEELTKLFITDQNIKIKSTEM